MADFRYALVALGEGRVDLNVLLERIGRLLEQKPQLLEPMLGQLEQAYADKLLSKESYSSISRHINESRRKKAGKKKQPQKPAAKAKAAKTRKAATTAAAVTQAAPTSAPIHEEDMASEIQAALAMAEQPTGGTATTDDFERADSLTSPGSAPASTGWAEPGKEQEAPAKPMDVGSVIKDRFELLDVLGQGGMGKVYKGIDLLKKEAKDKNPYVAIKLLNEDFKRHPEAFIALQRESSRQQKLAHPNIATVYDFDRIGTSGTQVYITMELMEGQPLNSYIRRTVKPQKGLPFEKAFPIIQGLGRALEYAHERYIVHSDFKPGNSFLCNDGTVKVLDFGIARAVKNPQAGDGEKTLFDPGKLGALTPAYASLEMLEGEEPDPRDDIYALGCVAYELLAGEHPFRKMPANVARDNRLTVAPVKGLKRRQMKALARALAFERKDRASDVATWLEELEGKAQWHKNPWVLAAGAVTALCLGLTYPTVNYLQQREIGILIESLKSGEPEFIEQELAKLDERDPRDKQRILDEARESIQEYYQGRVKAVAFVEEKRYKYPQAEQFLMDANKFYPDSLWLKEETDRLEDEKNQLLYKLTTEYIERRENKALLPDKQKLEVTDTLETIAEVDPDNAILKDPQLSTAYEDIAKMELAQGRAEQALAYVKAGLQRAPDHSGLKELKDKVLRLQRIAELDGKIRPALASLKSLDDYQALSADILALAKTDPKNPLLGQLAEGMASAFVPEFTRIDKEGTRAEATAATEKYGKLLNGLGLSRELSQLKLAHLKGAAREEAIREFVGNSKASLEKLLEEPKSGDSDWEGQVQADLQQLGTLLPPGDATLNALQEKVFEIYAEEANAAAAENSFSRAYDKLDLVEGWIEKNKALVQAVLKARAAVENTEKEYNAEQARIVQEQKIEENKVLLGSALNARQLDGAQGAEAILQKLLNQGMRTDDPFLVDTAFPKFEEAYLRLATEKEKAGDITGARALIERGLKIVPGSPKLENRKNEYEFKEDASYLRGVFGNSPTIADAGIGQRLGRMRNANPQQYPTLAQEFAQQLTGRIQGLLTANPPQAAQLAGNAARLFPESAQLQALLQQISVPPWDGTEAQTALDGNRLSQAAIALEKAPPGNADAQQLLARMNEQQGKARQAYAAFETARDAKNLQEAKKQLQAALGLWADNSEYKDASQKLAAAARAAKPERLLGREADITQAAQQQVAAAPAANGAASKEAASASDAPQAPRAAGEKVAKVEPVKVVPWTPIISDRPCEARLAGHGRRSKAVCFDMIDNSLRGPLMVVIPEGSTSFGTAQKQISIASKFAISKYEISVNDYNKYCHVSKECELLQANKDMPVTQISAKDATKYAKWLSVRTNKPYRLPTATEWEYAVWVNGKQPKKDFNCRVVLGDKVLKGTGLISVKSGKSNAWGLKNYLGNAQEWVTIGEQKWHARGGAYSDSLSNCAPELDRPHAGDADGATGFRLVRGKIG